MIAFLYTMVKDNIRRRPQPRVVPPRPSRINRIPARNYEPDTCDRCGYIFDPSVTSDVELVTGLCQTCWSNSYKMEETT